MHGLKFDRNEFCLFLVFLYPVWRGVAQTLFRFSLAAGGRHLAVGRLRLGATQSRRLPAVVVAAGSCLEEELEPASMDCSIQTMQSKGVGAR